MSNCQFTSSMSQPPRIVGSTPEGSGTAPRPTINTDSLFGNQRPGVGVDPSAQPRREQACRADIVKTRTRPTDHQSGLLLLVNLYQAFTPVPPLVVTRAGAVPARTQTAAVHIS
jgi:hypothetical protein